MGSIYKRGKVWWIQYYRNGRAYQESAKSTKKMVARKLLELREGEVAQGKLPTGIHFEKVTFDDVEKIRGEIVDFTVQHFDSADEIVLRHHSRNRGKQADRSGDQGVGDTRPHCF